MRIKIVGAIHFFDHFFPLRDMQCKKRFCLYSFEAHLSLSLIYQRCSKFLTVESSEFPVSPYKKCCLNFQVVYHSFLASNLLKWSNNGMWKLCGLRIHTLDSPCWSHVDIVCTESIQIQWGCW